LDTAAVWSAVDERRSHFLNRDTKRFVTPLRD
jgi:hypothetical protein